jgi:transcriptional regulator of aromatic amino acid metabolism
MRLEFARIEEANDLLNQLIEHHPNAIFVVDSYFKIKFFNKSFQKLCEREKQKILDHEFCETLGCANRGKNVVEVNRFCQRCQMRELMSGANISELEIIRDFSINNEYVTKHLRINTHRIIMDNQKYRLVIIEDKTQKHL